MNQKISFVSAKDASAATAIDKAGIWSVGAVYIDRSKDYKLCQAGQTDSALMWNLNSSASKHCCVEHKIHRGHLFLLSSCDLAKRYQTKSELTDSACPTLLVMLHHQCVVFCFWLYHGIMVGATWQFLDDLAPGASVIAFMDSTKLGRLSAKDLDYHMELLQRSLTRRPHQSIALVTAPIYASERVGNALRSEAAPLHLFYRRFLGKNQCTQRHYHSCDGQRCSLISY